MIGEINVAGVFISPLLLCMIFAFVARILLSRIFDVVGLYRLIWHRPLFDTALFLVLIGVAFIGLRAISFG